jgi:hypothetical protein
MEITGWKKRLAGFVVTVAATTNSSCTTTLRTGVIERSDELKSTPAWARLDAPLSENPGKIIFTGFVTVPGQSSKSAALNMADEKALSEPMRNIVSAFLDQNQVGEDLRSHDQVGQRIISATRNLRPAMPSLRITRRYWETRVTQDPATGETLMQLHAWAQAEVDESDFVRARRETLHRMQGEPQIRQILDEVGKEQREVP